MASPIFKNRSYIFTMGLSEALELRINQLGSRLGFRVMAMPSLADCQEGAAKTDHLLCVVGQGSLAALDKDNFSKATGVKIFTIGAGAELQEDDKLEGQLQGLLSSSVASNFKKMAILALDVGVSSLSGGATVSFKEDYSYFAQPEALIYTDLVDGTLFLRGQIEFQLTQAQGGILHSLGSEKKIVDFFKEVSNQMMGIVSHNMRKLGLDTRGGVPYFADLRGSEPPKFSNFFWGGQFSAAELPGVKVRLGYFDSAKNPIPDYASIEIDTPDSEVEFL